MSPGLPDVRARDLARVDGKIGFVLARQRGSHAVYYRESDHARVVTPMHGGQSIKPKTLAAIIQDMGLTTEQFIQLL